MVTTCKRPIDQTCITWHVNKHNRFQEQNIFSLFLDDVPKCHRRRVLRRGISPTNVRITGSDSQSVMTRTLFSRMANHAPPPPRGGSTHKNKPAGSDRSPSSPALCYSQWPTRCLWELTCRM
uniref:Uncharacterized protein n=1 Tax=Sphaerodactylus townsendi TaxID=933632 RepID=A0ACB8FZL0_9SAUR